MRRLRKDRLGATVLVLLSLALFIGTAYQQDNNG